MNALGLFEIASILLVLAAVFGYANHRFLELPPTIGLVIVGTVVSLALVAIDRLAPGAPVLETVQPFLQRIDLDEAVLEGVLCFLLFAGALHVELETLLEKRWVIGTLATVGVLISTAIVGTGSWALFRAFGFEVPFLHCLVFGALISPTDPVAVLGILKTVEVPKSLEAKIAGESLFNDGVGVVVFLVLVALVAGGEHGPMGPGEVAILFVQEVGGGACLGLLAGYVAFAALKSIDEYALEVLITIALVMGTYSLAMALHLSGPIAVVVEGLLLGNVGRQLAMSHKTVEHLDTFWELMDEILNAVLFLVIGLEVALIDFEPTHLLAGIAAIPLAVFARFAAVGLPIQVLRLRESFTPHVVKILTVAGLKGGISVALVLSLPDLPHANLLVTATFAVVLFTIIGQGLMVRRVLDRCLGDTA